MKDDVEVQSSEAKCQRTSSMPCIPFTARHSSRQPYHIACRRRYGAAPGTSTTSGMLEDHRHSVLLYPTLQDSWTTRTSFLRAPQRLETQLGRSAAEIVKQNHFARLEPADFYEVRNPGHSQPGSEYVEGRKKLPQLDLSQQTVFCP